MPTDIWPESPDRQCQHCYARLGPDGWYWPWGKNIPTDHEHEVMK